MPYLSEQVKLIDANLGVGVWSHKAFAKSQINGLCRQIADNSEGDEARRKFPVKDEGFEPVAVGPDDSFDVVTWHRTTATAYSYRPSGYGDGNPIISETASMRMLVWARGARIGISSEDLVAVVVAAMPTQIPKPSLAQLKIDTMAVTLVSTEFDSFVVFTEEFVGTRYSIGPEDFLVRINYQILTQSRKNCVSLCDCLPQ